MKSMEERYVEVAVISHQLCVSNAQSFWGIFKYMHSNIRPVRQ